VIIRLVTPVFGLEGPVNLRDLESPKKAFKIPFQKGGFWGKKGFNWAPLIRNLVWEEGSQKGG